MNLLIMPAETVRRVIRMPADERYCEPTFGYSLFGPIELPAAHIAQALANPDSIANAYALGRLDLVSLFLGTLTLFLALAAIAGYWMLRSAVVRRAEAEARQEVQLLLPNLARQWLTQNPDALAHAVRQNRLMLAAIVAEMDLSRGNDRPTYGESSDEAADAIAEAMEGGGNGDSRDP